MLRMTYGLVFAAFSLAFGHVMVLGQASPSAPADSAKGTVIGTGTFTGFVENMDRSLAFYHDAFGMEVPPLPASGSRPYNPPNPQLFRWFDIVGARERHQSARVPGTRVTVELMEIQDVEHKTIPLRIQDPGAATPVLIVRDVDAAVARASQAGAVVITPGGKPVGLADGGRAILVRDVDGRFIELRQSAAAPAATGDILDMRLSIAVNDMSQTTRFYRDVLGFAVEGETAFAADQPTRLLTGLAKADVRRARVQAPGSMLWIELVEFTGVDRIPLRMRIQDRGAARLQLRAQNIDALVFSIITRRGRNSGARVGGVVAIPPNLKGVVVVDPNNFFLTPYAPCDGCAPGLQAPARK